MTIPRLPEEAIRPAAEISLRQYASEYTADHLTWRDFADETREVLEAAWPVLAAHAAATEREAIRQLAISEAARYDAMPPAYDLRVRAIALRKFADLLRGPEGGSPS